MFQWVLVSITTGKVIAGFTDFEMLRSAWKCFSFSQRLDLRVYNMAKLDNVPNNGYVEV